MKDIRQHLEQGTKLIKRRLEAKQHLNFSKNRAVCARYYSRRRCEIKDRRRGRYVLKQPNVDMKEQCLTELKCNIIANLKVNASLRKAFTAMHDNIAKNLLHTGLAIAVCRLAAQKVLTEALKLRKDSAGKLLGSITKINELDITPDELGEQVHGASSEPYFYHTAYTPLQRQSAIPVDEHGQCVIAEEVLDIHGQPYLQLRWKCTLECKLPTEEEITSICCIKDMFKQPVQQLYKGFEDLDIDCPHVHRLLPPPPYPIDNEDNEEQPPAVSPVVPSDGHESDKQWMGHPFPCTVGRCGSQLRIIRAAAVHYPLLRRFLNLLYLARRHHHRVFDIDMALCSADFQKLMRLTDIHTYDQIYKNGISKSGCNTSENSVPGLPNLEAELKVRHADLIMSLEKKVNDYPS